MSEELDEIQAIFFEECAEGLAAAEAGLSAMQAGDVAPATIAGVFRAVHSIKGGAGAFGHAELTAFAHAFENLLDEIRAGRIAPSGGIVRAMLTAFDILSDHVAAAQGHTSRPADGAALATLEAILADPGVADAAPATNSAPEQSPVGAETAEDPFADPFGFEPVTVVLDELDAPAETARSGWTIRFVPSRAALANGSEPLLVVREIEMLGGRVESVDFAALPGLRDLDPEEGYFTWNLSLPGDVQESAIGDCFDFVAPDSVVETTRHGPVCPAPALPPQVETQEAPKDEVRSPDQRGDPLRARPVAEAAQTIRVDLSKLDLLLNLVGELVIRNSILADRLAPADRQRVELPELARLTRQIQDNVMSLRAQPIRQAFSRVPRMLRDLSVETGKAIRLETSGETTEVDKGVIEKIGDPLTHMIRNAADHGIESAEERRAAGKPAEGVIQLSAEQKGARIFVRVTDDGRGIDRERVRAKAIEKGIIAAEAVLSDEDIDQLICAPGFSTAESISSISGRGVGMDVVRSNVEALGGRVEIHSVPGKGTSITMALPLTLAILDGMIVRLGGQRFVLPLAHVVEAVRPEPGQVQAMTPTTEVIDMRGNYVPVRRATEIFGIPDDRRPEDALVIIVESESAGQVGLMVDTIDDRREVVIKSLDQNLHPIRGLSGATILGDGSIALMLDIEALASLPANTNRLPKGIAA